MPMLDRVDGTTQEPSKWVQGGPARRPGDLPTRQAAQIGHMTGPSTLPSPEGLHYRPAMLLDGLNHVAVLTSDTDRLHAFYTEVFDAAVAHDDPQQKLRFSILHVGPHTEFNVFELHGNHTPPPQVPMF